MSFNTLARFYVVKITLYLFLRIFALFLKKKMYRNMEKTLFYLTAFFEKRLIEHKQKKSFIYFNNELSEVGNLSF